MRDLLTEKLIPTSLQRDLQRLARVSAAQMIKVDDILRDRAVAERAFSVSPISERGRLELPHIVRFMGTIFVLETLHIEADLIKSGEIFYSDDRPCPEDCPDDLPSPSPTDRADYLSAETSSTALDNAYPCPQPALRRAPASSSGTVITPRRPIQPTAPPHVSRTSGTKRSQAAAKAGIVSQKKLVSVCEILNQTTVPCVCSMLTQHSLPPTIRCWRSKRIGYSITPPQSIRRL